MNNRLDIDLYEKEFLFNVSKLFTVPKILKLTDNKHKQYLSKVLSQTHTGRKKKFSVNCTYDWFYQILVNQYRCEYIYKNEIAKQLLLEKHPNGDARMFTEVEVFKSKADVLIVNGTSTVYEIKTELDSFDRLHSQLESYCLVFDKVYVVTHPTMVLTLRKKVAQTIGIMILDPNGTIRTIRKASSNKKNLVPDYIFNILNKAEYLNIIQKHFGYVPQSTPVALFDECKKIFCQIPPAKAHDYMVKELRARNAPAYKTEFTETLPDSLKLLGSANLSQQECKLINSCLEVFLPVSTKSRKFATKH